MLEADQLQRLTTADGSSTLRNRDLNVLYRSDQGALGESRHVFIEGTRLHERRERWRVLELGFGTGLNFLNTAREAAARGVGLDYHSIDAYPIPPQFLASDLGNSESIITLLDQVRLERTSASHHHDGISLTLYPSRWQDLELEIEPVHSVFHDPFDPNTNPDCWTSAAFAWSRRLIRPDGILATYSAAGHIRRAMRDAGYVVARAPGFGKKREMTLASPTEASLSSLRIKYRP